MVYKCFDKKISASGFENENMSDQQLAEELHKPIIKKIKKRKVHSYFIDNIWDVDIADMQLIVNLIKDLEFYYKLFIFSVKMHGLFL